MPATPVPSRIFAPSPDEIKEANDTSLLDNTIFTYGSGLGDGATHQYSDLPIIVAGRGGGLIESGRHLVAQPNTPLCNLYVTLLQGVGLEAERFGDSTGTLAL